MTIRPASGMWAALLLIFLLLLQIPSSGSTAPLGEDTATSSTCSEDGTCSSRSRSSGQSDNRVLLHNENHNNNLETMEEADNGKAKDSADETLNDGEIENDDDREEEEEEEDEHEETDETAHEGNNKKDDKDDDAPLQDDTGVDEWDEAFLGACGDMDPMCANWASEGECDANPEHVLRTCPQSCGICQLRGGNCVDENASCSNWADKGECDKNPRYMLQSCRKSCRECFTRVTHFGAKQSLRGVDAERTAQALRESFRYMNDVVRKLSFRIRRACRNVDSRCSFWAATGECDANPAYMRTKCGPACRSCHLLDPSVRCPVDPAAPNALGPGELHQMFERIASAPLDSEIGKLEPVILSRPYGSDKKHELIAQRQANPVHHGPWIIAFDHFLTEQECDRFVEFAQGKGFERSQDVGAEQDDGTFGKRTSVHRTSENTWCDEVCKSDAVIQPVLQRIANVTGFPLENSEDLQLLRYTRGQFYREHHDFIDHQVERPSGPRILTLFLYLNNVTAGGGTRFRPLHNLTVQPRKGKALLWPSIVNDDLHKREEYTYHEALPVEKGIKYGANAWLHLRDFQSAAKNNCI